jgi:hypothetical protein
MAWAEHGEGDPPCSEVLMEKLKRCPFCDGHATISERATKHYGEPIDKFFTYGYQIRCLNALCGCLTRQDAVLEDLIRIWNTRANAV